MFEYTFNKPNIIFLELIDPLLQDINLQPYTLEYSTDILKIIYSNELTNEQYNELNVFITSYNPPLSKPDVFHSSIPIQIINNKISNNDWVLVGTCHYIPNVDVFIKSENITFISNVDIGNYQIRIYNLNINVIIGTSNVLNNTIREVNTITINNIPTVDSIIELHAKVSDVTSKCNLDSSQLNIFVKN